MKMKKVMALTMAAAMVFTGLVGCGKSDSSETKGDAAGTQTETEAEAGTVYKVGIVQYVDDASLNQI